MKNPELLQDVAPTQDFLTAIKGSFTSALRWHHLDDLWSVILTQPEGWYIYALSEEPPQAVSAPQELEKFVQHINQLLREEHDHDYCGIVYSDKPSEPSLVKIYDPNNLGVSCGYSTNPPLPGWILSRIPPAKLEQRHPTPAGRRRWWQKLFG